MCVQGVHPEETLLQGPSSRQGQRRGRKPALLQRSSGRDWGPKAELKWGSWWLAVERNPWWCWSRLVRLISALRALTGRAWVFQRALQNMSTRDPSNEWGRHPSSWCPEVPQEDFPWASTLALPGHRRSQGSPRWGGLCNWSKGKLNCEVPCPVLILKLLLGAWLCSLLISAVWFVWGTWKCIHRCVCGERTLILERGGGKGKKKKLPEQFFFSFSSLISLSAWINCIGWFGILMTYYLPSPFWR